MDASFGVLFFPYLSVSRVLKITVGLFEGGGLIIRNLFHGKLSDTVFVYEQL